VVEAALGQRPTTRCVVEQILIVVQGALHVCHLRGNRLFHLQFLRFSGLLNGCLFGTQKVPANLSVMMRR
jgi:hypothetical protein